MATRHWVFRCDDKHHHTVRDDVRSKLLWMDTLMIIDGKELVHPSPGGDVVLEIDSSHLIINVSSKTCPGKYPLVQFPSPMPFSLTMKEVMAVARAEAKKETCETMEKMKSDFREEMLNGYLKMPDISIPSTFSRELDLNSRTLSTRGKNAKEDAPIVPVSERLIDEFLEQRREEAEATAEADLKRFPDLRSKLSQRKRQRDNLRVILPCAQDTRAIKKVHKDGSGKRVTWGGYQIGNQNDDLTIPEKKPNLYGMNKMLKDEPKVSPSRRQDVKPSRDNVPTESPGDRKPSNVAVEEPDGVGPVTRNAMSNKDETEASFIVTSQVQNGIQSNIEPMYAEFLGEPRSYINTRGTRMLDYMERCAPIVKISYAVWTPNWKKVKPRTQTLETLLDPLTNSSFITGFLNGSSELGKLVSFKLKRSRNQFSHYIRWLNQTQFGSREYVSLEWYAEKIMDDGSLSELTSRQFSKFSVLDRCDVEIPVLGFDFLKRYKIYLNPEATEIQLIREDYNDILELPISRWVILTEKVVHDKDEGILGAQATPNLISKVYRRSKTDGRDILMSLWDRGEEVRQAIMDQCPRHFEYDDVTPGAKEGFRKLNNDEYESWIRNWGIGQNDVREREEDEGEIDKYQTRSGKQRERKNFRNPLSKS